jgi:hypothetical protein
VVGLYLLGGFGDPKNIRVSQVHRTMLLDKCRRAIELGQLMGSGIANVLRFRKAGVTEIYGIQRNRLGRHENRRSIVVNRKVPLVIFGVGELRGRLQSYET